MIFRCISCLFCIVSCGALGLISETIGTSYRFCYQSNLSSDGETNNESKPAVIFNDSMT
jgi:hypothetical protein